MFVDEIRNSLLGVLEDIGAFSVSEIQLEHPADFKNGDYSSNIALMLAKKEKKSPKELAEEIKTKWQEIGLPDCIEKIAVAGPGFINIWLKIDILGKQLVEVLKQGEKFGEGEGNESKTVVVDYSAPNIAKPFGIGHLRSTNIGQALLNIYKFLGHKTIGDNHLGDWGTQFGKLIYQIIAKGEADKVKRGELSIGDLERLYVEFHKEAENKPEMEEEARRWFKKLEEGDVEAKQIWQACVDISLKEFNRVYELLEVKIDHTYGESFYLDKMNAVLDDCRSKGLLKESQGAQVIELPGTELPAMLIKSDGATTYLLRDLATVKFRKETWHPDLYIYEVGADQSLHFAQVFKICELLDYAKLSQFVHVPHGLIRWATGKFSTRQGMTIHLEEILDEAVVRAEKLCESSGVAKQLDPKEKEVVATAIGIGAVKYNDLKQNPRTDIIFDWDAMLTLSGNSGPYLQYTFARTQSVLAKSSNGGKIDHTTLQLDQISSDEERALLRTLYKFPEAIAESAKTFSPNLIANFLFDISQKFNLFYDKQRIIGSATEQFRLILTDATGQILKNGLTLLGIQTLEKM